MRQVDFESNPRQFFARHGAWLKTHQVEHNVILSICQLAERQIARGETPAFRAAVLRHDGETQLIAVQAPPHNLILSRGNADDVSFMVGLMAEAKQPFPAIVGPSDMAGAFAEEWTRQTGHKTVEYMDQIIYALKTVHFPPPVEGVFRLAHADETQMLADWAMAFAKDTLPHAEQPDEKKALEKTAARIEQGSLAVWDVNGKAVSQAGVSGTDSVARVKLVYTPPEYRGKGYASAVVAQLSQQLLTQGRGLCCLYANARNPVSNAIYRKIGYEFVGRSSLYILEK